MRGIKQSTFRGSYDELLLNSFLSVYRIENFEEIGKRVSLLRLVLCKQ